MLPGSDGPGTAPEPFNITLSLSFGTWCTLFVLRASPWGVVCRLQGSAWACSAFAPKTAGCLDHPNEPSGPAGLVPQSPAAFGAQAVRCHKLRLVKHFPTMSSLLA